MKTARKSLLIALCAVLLVVASVMGTLAYLTDDTTMVTNTFTVGKVTIELDETDVDLYGVKDGETPVKANTYKLVNGHTYTKDPTVHVTAGSEPVYLFVKVVNPLATYESNAEGDKTIADQMEENGWLELSGVENVYYYNGVVDAREAKQDKIVFGSFKIGDSVTLPETAPANITIDAYAIQADGFQDTEKTLAQNAADAWTAGAHTWGN